MAPHVTPTDVSACVARLPAFPAIVNEALAALDDDGASMSTLVSHLQRDPVLAGRLLSAANRANRRSGPGTIRDVYTAASLIGMRRIREIVVTTSLMEFARHSRASRFFWEHSLAVGICAQELGRKTGVHPEQALVAGLLHDIGQLWMSYFYPLDYQRVLLQVENDGTPICAAEQAIFGLDHGQVGRRVAEDWHLPVAIVAAIAAHHQAGEAAMERLAAVTCLAELCANGLDLPYRAANQVTGVPPGVLQGLGLDPATDLPLGAMEARFHYARALLN